jgi:dGTPase
LPREEIEVLGTTVSERVDTLVRDLVERSSAAGDIVQGEEVGGAMGRLRRFMFERVYLGDHAQSERGRIERMMKGLFDFYVQHPPVSLVAGATDADRVTDYLAGMTDRFALRAFEELSIPRGF